MPGGLDPLEMGRYWLKHGDVIRQRFHNEDDKQVYTTSYIASYQEDLPEVFDVLDDLAKDAEATDAKPH